MTLLQYNSISEKNNEVENPPHESAKAFQRYLRGFSKFGCFDYLFFFDCVVQVCAILGVMENAFFTSAQTLAATQRASLTGKPCVMGTSMLKRRIRALNRVQMGIGSLGSQNT